MRNDMAKQLIRLLHGSYHSCDVFLLKNEEDFMEYRLSDCFRRELDGCETEQDSRDVYHEIISSKNSGQYHNETKEVQLYLFNIEDDDYKNLHIIFTLYHELRHFSQDMRGKLKRKYEKELERDCDKFALRMIYRNQKEIENIIECKLFPINVG